MAARIAIAVLLLLSCVSDSKKIKEKHRSSRPHDDHVSEDVPSPHEQRLLSLVIEHAFGKEPFSRRGTALLRSLKSSRDVTFHQESLTTAQVKSLQKAAAADGLYFIRTSTSLSSIDEEQPSTSDNVTTVSTFVSACALIKSNFNDRIVINGDGKGNVYGLTLLPAVSVLNDDLECSSVRVSNSGASFTTAITYSTGETGPAPDTQGFIQKVEAEKAKMETEDNRSFFQKYWLYILIGFVAFQFLAGSGGAAGGGAGGGGGGGQ